MLEVFEVAFVDVVEKFIFDVEHGVFLDAAGGWNYGEEVHYVNGRIVWVLWDSWCSSM